MTASQVPGIYSPDRRLPARIQRRLVQWRAAAPIAETPKTPIISFTFDDFPKSAAEAGARIVEDIGARATYFVAAGLAGQSLLIGDMFEAADLQRLKDTGHELASHTYSHRDCARMPQAEALADIAEGDAVLGAMTGGSAAQVFAFPFGETTFELKLALSRRFACSRGILSGINRRGSDLAQLRSVELGDDGARLSRALRSISECVRRPGWLIFYTHDVRHSPSAYGVSPANLKRIADAARASGARILTMGEALKAIGEQGK
jgi:peptidoglycan/xylan/chitin deacetylase (PgdA/CDA1 family)